MSDFLMCESLLDVVNRLRKSINITFFKEYREMYAKKCLIFWQEKIAIIAIDM